jgi:nucleoside-diphosphate-sugar epimerase
MATPTVLITGIAGFIARHCAAAMLQAGPRHELRMAFISAPEVAAAMAQSRIDLKLVCRAVTRGQLRAIE